MKDGYYWVRFENSKEYLIALYCEMSDSFSICGCEDSFKKSKFYFIKKDPIVKKLSISTKFIKL